jgi:subtilisin-like proprotein convertase family protein
VAGLLLCAGYAGAATFSNTGTITIANNANATPYPSSVSVTGLAAPVSDINVRLLGFSHTTPDDVGIVLVAPGGQALLLMDGATDKDTPQAASNLNITLDGQAAAQMGDNTALASQSYKPTSYYTGDTFPAPGPVLTYQNPGPALGNSATFASTFNGLAPNGTWNLFVRDFVGAFAGTGSISGGWSLEVTAPNAPTPVKKKKCKKKGKKHSAAAAKKKCKKKKK